MTVVGGNKKGVNLLLAKVRAQIQLATEISTFEKKKRQECAVRRGGRHRVQCQLKDEKRGVDGGMVVPSAWLNLAAKKAKNLHGDGACQ